MSSIKDLLGDFVINSKGEKVETSTFMDEGKVVGLYFSAHWCPPCRAFTPVLGTFYSDFKAGDKGANLELVFVSSDRDEASFKEYFGTMPFHALPFEESDTKAKLSKRYKVQGIPSLIFLDANTGKVINDKGRDCVTNDLKGEDFPWRPVPIGDILKGSYLRGKDTVDGAEVLDGKVKGLYFSAHWCPPCRAFTPDLVAAYDTLKTIKNFEMVFVSWDRSEESFNLYFNSMPWLALPYGDKRANLLKTHFNIEGIPTLIIIDENNELITSNGRVMVSSDPDGKNFPWHPKALEPLVSYSAPKINDDPALILFGTTPEGETGKSWEDKVSTAIGDVAKLYKEECKTNPDLPTLNFFYEVEEEDDLSESLRLFAQLGDKEPLLALLDIPDQRVYVSPMENITKEVVEKLIDDFKMDKLEFRGLRQ